MIRPCLTLAAVCIVSIASSTLAGHTHRDSGDKSWSDSIIGRYAFQNWNDPFLAYDNTRHDSIGAGQWRPTSTIEQDKKRLPGWSRRFDGGRDNYQVSHGRDHGYDSGHHSISQDGWKPYRFAYSSQSHDGSSDREEKTDGRGRVIGWYKLTTADGRKRKVTYVADENGFRAKVETNEQGTANENPANVHLRSHAPKVIYPVPAPKNHNSWDNIQVNQDWFPSSGTTESAQESWTGIARRSSKLGYDQPQQGEEWNQQMTVAKSDASYGGVRIRKQRHQDIADDTSKSRTGYQGWSISRNGPNGGSWSARHPSLVKSSVHWNSNSNKLSSNGAYSDSSSWLPNNAPNSSSASVEWTDDHGADNW
ncbi:uncharacterized protein LOC111254681 isoform X2 [Varroa destructor]|uniref:Uncharacterized protein n=1 Tax=Varroa destructor TaxID=109461 RepID=A0A7M7KZM9_VARDE|nr:uncharacterized protein LOC111254681 isoform X1 [Varroa destructor]XP_022671517.1 uncharacterized protein LOC111254681 isoform X1 [Varroa destructor]XP_022671518.1 uncharacterized protein LOC111254681 isoform X1 [Varroa destructor]XP_022671519.1 uncharacterized protein LOC111254681 isoform X2 [Varroa destructor]